MFKLPMITFISFLVLSPSWAQVRGGGGPSEYRVPPGMTREEFVMLKIGYDKLVSRMNQQWKKCGNDSTIKFNTLSEVYVQLTWRDSARRVNCSDEEIEGIRACFFDSQMKSELRTLLNHKNYRSFIGIFEDPITELEIYRYFSMEANRVTEGKDE